MATPKRERNPAPPDTPLREGRQSVYQGGGSERGLLAIIEYFGPRTTIGEIDAAAIEEVIEQLADISPQARSRQRLSSRSGRFSTMPSTPAASGGATENHRRAGSRPTKPSD